MASGDTGRKAKYKYYALRMIPVGALLFLAGYFSGWDLLRELGGIIGGAGLILIFTSLQG